ncbi:ABC transporter substrate-binding protein [Fibrobacter sp.]|uniref:ABC transporter substrate-binding protein n=1 Tax=Fibrobacter sp. TaxID=35828 RepID=UPI00388FFA92
MAPALFLSVAAILGSGCGNGEKTEKLAEKCGELPELEFSRNLKIGTTCGQSIAEIRSIVGRDTLVRRFILKKGATEGTGTVTAAELPPELSAATVLQVPLQKVVALSSAQVGYMVRLGVQDRIVAVGEGRYIVDSAVYAGVASGTVAEVSNGNSLDLEKLIALQPDLTMTFATGGAHDDYERINALGLPLMLTSEWQEESPLAKAEWIKLYGALFGMEALADSIFEQSKNAYLQAVDGGVAGVSPARGGSEQQRANEGETSPHKSTQDDTIPHSTFHIPHSPCPRVLVGMSYGGVWYAPGGNSFTARLIKDAGGCYLWAADTSRELKFTLEEIMAIADSVDVWVNPGMFSTPDEILAAEPRVKFIKAFREKHVCQNDGVKGPGGGNDFYESAVAYPAEMLQNLHRCLQNATNGADSTLKEFDWYRNIFIF